MKKTILIAALAIMAVLLTAAPAHCQRNIPGERSVKIMSGMVDGIGKGPDGETRLYATAAYTVTMQNKHRWLLGLGYLQKDYAYGDKYIPKARFMLEGGYTIPLYFGYRKIICLNFGVSALAGYETINWGKKTLHDGATLQNKDAFVYGLAASAEIEAYVTDNIAFGLMLREMVAFGSSLGRFNTIIGMGLRFIIN